MQFTKYTEERKIRRLKRLLKEYYVGLMDSAEGFETGVFEIIVWSTYRREIGENATLLSEEERLKVLEADGVALKLAQEKKDTEAGLGFEQMVKVIKEYLPWEVSIKN